MGVRGFSVFLAMLIVLLRPQVFAATLEQAGYANVASIDLLPVMDLAPIDVAIDAAGNAYVLGTTFTAAPGSHLLGPRGSNDLAVAKFSASGELMYSVVIGGTAADYGDRILLDGSGHAFVAGWTSSADFPIVNAPQSSFNPSSGPFLCRVAPDGASLVYSTYLGGHLNWSGALAVTPRGEAIVAGTRARSSQSYEADAIVLKLAERGSNVMFSATFGGISGASANALALDPNGGLWVAGGTSSPDFPVTPDAAQAFPHLPLHPYGSSDAFLVKLDDAGSVLYSTFWGTLEQDTISHIAFRDDGAMFVARSILVTPIAQPFRRGTDGPFQPVLPEPAPEANTFITLLDPYNGLTLAEAAVPSLGYNVITRLAADDAGNAHITGNIASGGYLAQFVPAQSAFLRFASLSTCAYSGAGGLAIGPAGSLFLNTFNANFASITESSLRKVAPSLPPPANRAPLVTLDAYAFLNTPGLRGSDYDGRTITPLANDTDGVIQQVELFADGILLKVFTNSPYTFVWSNAPVGEHILRAIATDNVGLSTTSCPALFPVAAPPANDSFYRSKSVSGANVTVTGTIAGATSELGEPSGDRSAFYDYFPLYGQGSVWWSWRAPQTGTFSVAVSNRYGNQVATVFTGTDLSNLISLGRGQTVAFRAIAGKVYYIRVTGFEDAYELSIAPVVSPPNDDFENRTLINGAPLIIQADNFNATYQDALPISSGDADASVWWTWTALTDGVYRISISAATYSSIGLRVLGLQSSGASLPFGGNTSVVMRAAAGEQFHIQVSGPNSQFDLRVESLAPPTNDYFSDAIALAGFPVMAAGSLSGATRETNEPPHDPFGTAGSVWYRWTAPVEGTVLLELASNNGSGALLAVYTGSSLAGLVPKVSSFGSYGSLRFAPDIGQQYYIAVASTSDSIVDFNLNLRRLNPPSNDNFDQLIVVTHHGFGSNAEASIEPMESIVLQGESESVWYRWTAPATDDYTLLVHLYGFFGRAFVWNTNSSGNLLPIANQNTSGSRFLRFSAIAGAEYAISFASSQNNGGDFAFQIRPADPPINDNFPSAIVLGGAYVLDEGSNVDATLEPGEPLYANSGSASVWWAWTAPSSGKFVVSLARATFSAGVKVYQGTQLGDLEPVSPSYALDGSSLFDAAVGEQYWFVVYSLYGDQGTFTLAVTPIAEPLNDDFANAIPIQGSKVSVSGTTLGATSEPTESAPSVWWTWTAPASGLTSLELSLNRPLEVFVGASLEALNRVAASANTLFGPSTVTFMAQAGITYHFRVSQQAFTPFTLSLNAPSPLERPFLSLVSHRADGAIQFTIDALIGTTNVIEASFDLQTWSPISTNLTDCFPFTFSTPSAVDPHRFYRARLVR